MTGQFTPLQQQFLRLMEIPVWLERNRQAVAEVTVSVPDADTVVEEGKAPAVQPDWETLQKQVASCTNCELHRTRTQTVFGVGDRRADWLLIGEAPGAEEDRQGEPFVGRAGKLLNSMLEAMGMQRQHVYIANILKCRPPDNRDPRPAEVVACEGYLNRQIAMIQPKIILALGRIAAQNLLKIEVPIGRMRGQRYSYGVAQTPVIVTYHPAYLLRSPREKRKSWQDLQLAMKIYRESK